MVKLIVVECKNRENADKLADFIEKMNKLLSDQKIETVVTENSVVIAILPIETEIEGEEEEETEIE